MHRAGYCRSRASRRRWPRTVIARIRYPIHRPVRPSHLGPRRAGLDTDDRGPRDWRAATADHAEFGPRARIATRLRPWPRLRFVLSAEARDGPPIGVAVKW